MYLYIYIYIYIYVYVCVCVCVCVCRMWIDTIIIQGSKFMHLFYTKK